MFIHTAKAAVVIFFLQTLSAYAAIALDRTRVIFPGSEKNVVLNIKNENAQKPFLAQAWLEDESGKRLGKYFTVLPPVQRVEPEKKSMIRINALQDVAALPQDRESVFIFNLREIPPRSGQSNVMQIALQTKIKLFYRPLNIIPERFSRWDNQLVLHKEGGGYRIENPTPYYMTVIAITGAKNQRVDKDFTPAMISPKSSLFFKSKIHSTPWITTIDDFGGKPVVSFTCAGATCTAESDRIN